MKNLKSLRNFFLFILIINPLIACSQGDDNADDLRQLQAHLDVAELYREQGQFRASIIEMQNAFQLDPENQDAMRLLAKIYIEIGDIASATTLLNSAYRLDSENPATILLLAEANISTGKNQDASALLDEFELPTGSDLANQKNILLARLSTLEGNISNAEALLESVLSSNAASIEALVLSSQIEYQAGNPDSSNAYLNQAIEADPDNLDLWIWRGQFAMLQQNYPVTEDSFLAALDIMSLYDTMTAKKFTVLQSVLIPLQMQQKNEEALRFSTLIASTPQGEFNSSYSAAVAIFQEGDMAQAEQALGDILNSAPNHPGSNILLGVAKYAQGNFSEAEEYLSTFVDVDSASPQLIKTLVATHLRLNQPDRALAVLEDAITNYPEDSSLLSLKGLSLQATGDLAGSIDTYQQAIEQADPANTEDLAGIHFALARSYVLTEDFPMAIDRLKESTRLNPDLSQAKTTLLNIYRQQDQLDVANEQIQTWLTQEPDSALNNSLAGIIATQYENYNEARSYFSRVLELDENDLQARLNLTRVDLVEEKYEDAVAGYERILQQDITNVTALSALLAIGDVTNTSETRIAGLNKIINDNPLEYTPPLVLSQYYLQTGNLDNALKYAEVAYGRGSNTFTQGAVVEVSRQKALSEAQNGNYQQAQTFVEKIKAIQPDVGSSYEIEGDLLLAQDQIDSALTSYLRAWELSAHSGVGVKLYRLYSRPDRDEDATQFLNDWIELQPADSSANLLAAMDYQGKDMENEAIEHYEVVFQGQPNNLIMLNNLAWMYKDRQPTRALELASHAAELYPENPDVLDTYGWILVQQDKRAEGISVLERAAALAPESEPIIEHLNTARAED